MFSRQIVWKGLVYAVLMAFGKIVCGIRLLRLPDELPPSVRVKMQLLKLPTPRLSHFGGKKSGAESDTSAAQTSQPVSDRVGPSPSPLRTHQEAGNSDLDLSITTAPAPGRDGSKADAVKPRSVYPASILGCAMTARGEVGFLISSIAEGNKIFASKSTAKSSSDMFLVTWAIVVCTILGPLAVGLLVRRVNKLQHRVEQQGRVVGRDVLGVWGTS